MRLNMRTYPAVVLSAVTVAALLASPAAARSRYYYYGYGGYYGGYYGPYYRSYGPYTPSLPVPPYGTYYDFQDGPRG
jgi:hypothetical protein